MQLSMKYLKKIYFQYLNYILKSIQYPVPFPGFENVLQQGNNRKRKNAEKNGRKGKIGDTSTASKKD